jgi:hypothetical protein
MLAETAVLCLAVAWWRRSRRLDREPARAPGSQVSVVFVASDGSAISTAIDAASGGRGYSHCFVDAGHRVGAKAVVIDYRPGSGVHFASPDRYARRELASILLPGEIGCELRRCVAEKLGEPFGGLGLVIGRQITGTCAGLIAGCLPSDVAARLPGRSVTPNDLAELLGAQKGRSIVFEH